jgi:hypothetical protein
MFSARGRYIFPWRTVLLPRLDAKISLRGRQFFLGGTIRSRPKISQKRRYSFPRRTIFCCVPAQELRVRVSGVPITPPYLLSGKTICASRWAVGGGRSLVVRERDDMGTLGHQCFPEGTMFSSRKVVVVLTYHHRCLEHFAPVCRFTALQARVAYCKAARMGMIPRPPLSGRNALPITDPNAL